MVNSADVLVENFAPGVIERLGLGIETLHKLNPRLIYAQSSGYGQDGPYRDYPAMDLTVQAMSGVMSITGFPDGAREVGSGALRFFAGVHLYGGIVPRCSIASAQGAAARSRSRCSKRSSVAGVHARHVLRAGWQEAARTGNRHGGLAESPYNVYPASDGYMAIICVGEQHRKICSTRWPARTCWTIRALDPQIPRRPHGRGRRNGRRVHQTIRQAGAVSLLMKHRVPCAPVRTLKEVVTDPHLHQRGMLQWVDHPESAASSSRQAPCATRAPGRCRMSQARSSARQRGRARRLARTSRRATSTGAPKRG